MTQTDSADHVGPIIFADATARHQLLQDDEVVTFRKTSRTTGETWWRESRLGPKQGDVIVTEIGEVNPKQEEALTEYCDLSGFDNVQKWQSAIRELNGSLPNTGFLYRVVTWDDD